MFVKVDNQIHLAAVATAKPFVNFVREKLNYESDEKTKEDQEIFPLPNLSAPVSTIEDI